MKKKPLNMVFLMLDLKFKSFCLTSSFIGYEQNKGHCWGIYQRHKEPQGQRLKERF